MRMTLGIIGLAVSACSVLPRGRQVQIERATPESQGFSSAGLAELLEVVHERKINIHSLTVLRNDRVVLDAYFYPYTRDMRHDVASVTKSITSLLTGLAIADGFLRDTAQPIVEALGEVTAADQRARRISIRDLLSMQSGLDCGFRRGEIELVEMRKTGNWAQSAMNLPIVADPGTRFGYCSPNFHLLSAAIATQSRSSTFAYARRRLFTPLDISDLYWPADSSGVNHGWGDLQMRPIDMAKIGSLLLHGGRWGSRQIIPTAWVQAIQSKHASVNQNDDYGLGWWISRNVPTLYEANGRGGQRITIIPAKNLVVVMTGGGFEPGDVGGLLLNALRADSALARDPAGEKRLEAALGLVSMPPSPRAISRPPASLPALRSRYTMAENRLAITSIALDFSDAGTAAMELRLADGTVLKQTLGLDGRYRLSPGQYHGTSAGRGEWLADGRFRAELNTLTRVNRYIFDMEFAGDALRINASEPTELGTATLTGIRSVRE